MCWKWLWNIDIGVKEFTFAEMVDPYLIHVVHLTLVYPRCTLVPLSIHWDDLGYWLTANWIAIYISLVWLCIFKDLDVLWIHDICPSPRSAQFRDGPTIQCVGHCCAMWWKDSDNFHCDRRVGLFEFWTNPNSARILEGSTQFQEVPNERGPLTGTRLDDPSCTAVCTCFQKYRIWN